MKHESIVVVYDSCQAVAEEIADKLGAEIISVQSLNTRHIANSQSFVLLLECQADGQLNPHWQYASQTLLGVSLRGKTFALFVVFGTARDSGSAIESFCSELRKGGAHIVGDLSYAESPSFHIEEWICLVSPNL